MFPLQFGRQKLVLGSIFALLIVLVVFPLFAEKSLYLRDISCFTYPMKEYVRMRLGMFQVPLWNPHLGLGRPVLAMVQPGVFYPGNLLLLLWPGQKGLDGFFVLHQVFLLVGSYRWLRSLSLDAPSALLGGILVGYSGYVLSVLAGHGAFLVGASWIPWILSVLAQGAKTVGPRVVWVGLLFACCAVSGEPQAVHLAILCSLLQICLVGGQRRARFKLLALGGILGILLSLPQLLAGIHGVSVGRSGGVPIQEASHFSLHPLRLFELLAPSLFGAPHQPGWYVHALYDEGTGLMYEPFASGIYLGLLPLALWFTALKKGTALDRFLAFWALLFLVLSLGRHTPLYSVYHLVVPGARYFRYPEKLFFVTTLGLAALFARGYYRTQSLPAPRLRLLLWLGLVLSTLWTCVFLLLKAGCLTTLVGRLGTVSKSSAIQGATDAWLRTGGILILYALPVLCAGGRLISATTLRYLLALVLLVDLSSANLQLLKWTDSTIYKDPGPIVRELKQHLAPGDRVYRPMALRFGRPAQREDPLLLRWTLLPNAGMEFGITHLNAYDNIRLPEEELVWTILLKNPLRLLQTFGGRFALLDPVQVEGPSRVPNPALKLLRDFPEVGARLYRVEGVAPRAYLAGQVVSAKGAHDAVRALLHVDFVPGRDAVVENGRSGSAEGRCTIVQDLPEKVQLRCGSTSPTYAVLGDAWFPGWEAHVNGTQTEILRANVLLRAVAIPAGTSEIVFEYRLRYVRWGYLGTLCGLAACLVLLLYQKRRPG